LAIKKQTGRERYCEIDFKSLREVIDWIGQYSVFWTKRLDISEEFLDHKHRVSKFAKAKTLKSQEEKNNDNMQTQQPFVIEGSYTASPEEVWKAITDKDQMKKWYFDISEFKAQIGFEFTFNGGNDDKIYVHLCKVIEVIPYKKLKHSWTYKDYEGISFVTWELFDDGNNTKVKLTHEGLETFPQNNPDFAKENFDKGWTYILGTSLKEFLEKAEIPAS